MMLRRLTIAIWLVAALLALVAAAPAPAPQRAPVVQSCNYAETITLGDDAGYLRGTPIGTIEVHACASPADLAAQVAQLEAQVRQTWAANRGGR